MSPQPPGDNRDATSSDQGGSDSELDEAFALYLSACDSGEITSRDDFLNKFPELSDQLRELMEAADMIGGYTQMGSPGLPAGPGVSDGTEGSWMPGFVSDEIHVDTDDPSTVNAEAVSSDRVALGFGNEDTIGSNQLGADANVNDFSGIDPNITLPMANRTKGDTGPSLPFELGDYTLLKVLGVGGMGVVYLAKQTELERLVAVKMIRSGILAGEAEVKRFYTEAKAAAKLRHPNIVAVHQFGRRAGHHFFSMQYIEGEDLQKVLSRGPLSCQRAAEIVRDVARAIEHAHQRGVLHRDLKPGNVLIGTGDASQSEAQIHVTDFGLAKHVDSDSSVTGSGEAVGTPHYMAPEQAIGRSEHATHQSDIYSLGAILFACVAGRPPLVGDTVMQTLMKVAHSHAPPLRSIRSDADPELEAIVDKCLEKKSADRYASAADLADDLDAYLAGEGIAARSRGRARRVWQWTSQVPVVAALMGDGGHSTPTGQRRFQASMIALAVILPIMFLAGVWLQQRSANAMPLTLRIAGGLPGGLYTDASTHLADAIAKVSGVPCEVEPTGGTWDNRERLLEGEFHLAPMQASAVGGEQLRVVAPLFYEFVHVLVRADGNILSVDELVGHPIAVGPEGSGSRRVADMVLESLAMTDSDCPRVVTTWPALMRRHQASPASVQSNALEQLVPGPSGSGTQASHGSAVDTTIDSNLPNVAIICIGTGSELLHDMLADNQWRLLPLPDAMSIALQHPTLRPMTIMAADYAEAELPIGGIQTVGTTGFLVSRADTADAVVEAALDALYEPPTLTGLIPARQAAEWPGLAFHPAARRYFNAQAKRTDAMAKKN